jgi:hypothetical protein
MTPCVISLSIGGKGKVEARSRSARCGRREKGQCGRTVEAIEQPITAPASSHFGVLERVQLPADVHRLSALSRVRFPVCALAH